MATSPPLGDIVVLIPVHTVAAVYAAWKDTDPETTQSLANTLARQMGADNVVRTDDDVLLTLAGAIILTCRMGEHAIASQRAMDEYRKFPR